jgi:hypothetical protein
MLALISFPFFIEPLMPLSVAAHAWSWLFSGCAVAALACGLLAARSRTQEASSSTDRVFDSPSEPLPVTRACMWILLSACAVVLFMGVTNELCMDVASIPFLWIVPLAVYLLTFILCFGSKSPYQRGRFIRMACVLTALIAWERFSPESELILGGGWFFPVLVGSYSLLLFSLCMILHGELFRLRPEPKRLTQYYMCISAGGALGGALVGIVAPQLFTGYYELPLAIAVSGVLALWFHWKDARAEFRAFPNWKFAASGIVVISVVSAVFVNQEGSVKFDELIFQQRSFFGVVRVYDFGSSDPAWAYRQMMHGTTNHGLQYLAPDKRRSPTTYFGPFTGLGLVMQRNEGQSLKVGIMGLGVGTVAAYGFEGDQFTFYEISHNVIRLSEEDSGVFTFLSDSAASVEVIAGDARLSLEAQLRNEGPQEFDILAMDAFLSDSIPVHLVTLEAFELYLQHLSPNGRLAVNISNRYLDLTGLMFKVADHFGMHAVVIHNKKTKTHHNYGASWVVFSRDEAHIKDYRRQVSMRRSRMRLKPDGVYTVYPDEYDWSDAPVWTDDFSDLFSVLSGL